MSARPARRSAAGAVAEYASMLTCAGPAGATMVRARLRAPPAVRGVRGRAGFRPAARDVRMVQVGASSAPGEW